MKAEIIEERNIGGQMFAVKIHLIPENLIEATSIRNVEAGAPDDNERTTVDNFLKYALSQKNYSPIEYLDQVGQIFTVKAYLN